MKIIKNIKLKFDLDLLSGLHIGSGKDAIKIGGIDSYVIKNPINEQPYIPGSSLKGKMRSLIEANTEKNQENMILKIFDRGADATTDQEITRIIVRDLFMNDYWQSKFNESKKNGTPFMEEKAENKIDRNSAIATPRFIERVPAEISFNGEIILKILEGEENEEELMKNLIIKSLELIESDALGGSGSRGYGQIKINNKIWESI